MDQRELESELQNMMKLHAEGIKQVKKMERVVRESDQRAKVSYILRVVFFRVGENATKFSFLRHISVAEQFRVKFCYELSSFISKDYGDLSSIKFDSNICKLFTVDLR